MKAEAQFPTPINATFIFGICATFVFGFLICVVLIKSIAAQWLD
jgi:hypothetical protein